MKIKICYIDDMFYGIPQVINSIPYEDYEFYYFNRIVDIEKIEYDIIILDFYLDKDNKTAIDIINSLKSKVIIGFSSEDSKNNLIIKSWWKYKATKLKWKVKNTELFKILKRNLN